MTKRDTRLVTLWKGDPTRVALANGYENMYRAGHVEPVDTFPFTEFVEDTGNANEDQWDAIRAIADFVVDTHKVRQGWYLTCAEPGADEPEWTMAFATPDIYDTLQEEMGSNPPMLMYLGRNLVCIQCML